jgi:hypothetical protein
VPDGDSPDAQVAGGLAAPEALAILAPTG